MIKNAIPKAIDQINSNVVSKGLNIAKELVLSDATRLVPVLTGRLRASLNGQIQNNSANVGTNVIYAARIEFGGSKKAPNGYLRPALYKNEDRIVKTFSNLTQGLERL